MEATIEQALSLHAFELILILLAAVLVSAVIDQVVPKISSPLIQIGLGVVIALVGMQFSSSFEVSINPELFLVLFIAPLLFYDAKRADRAALIRHIKPVVSLAIGLVLLTVLIVGFSVHWLVPSIPLAAAFALAAALGPTDAVAVSSLSKDVSLTTRQKALLNGEFLINDASGIVSFQFAIAAVTTGAFSLLSASGEFVISFFGGIALGVVLGLLSNFAMRKARSHGFDNTTFHVLFDLFQPFIIYLLAESIGASGILAVVAAGLATAIAPPEVRPSVSRLNIVSNSVWQVFAFTLNGIVFVLLGLQLPEAMSSTWESAQVNNPTLILYIVIITVVLMGVRFLWMLALDWVGMRKREGRSFKASDIRDTLVTTLSGPKGAITLAIVFSIPLTFGPATDPVDFPQRSLIIFLASGVIILTLFLATFVVPVLAPKKKDAGAMEEGESEAVLEIMRTVIENLTANQTPENKFATLSVVRSYNQRIARIKDSSDIDVERNKELRIKVLRWEQDYVLDLIEQGEVDSYDGYQQLNHLAHIQNLIKHQGDNGWLARNALRNLNRIVRAVWRRFRHLTPGPDSVEYSEAMRQLQVKTTQFAIKRLEEEMRNPEAPNEEVGDLLIEYQAILSRLNSIGPGLGGGRPDMARITRSASSVTDVARKGLELELELIQSMYESDRITRSTANRMRDNVYLMQYDLEDSA